MSPITRCAALATLLLLTVSFFVGCVARTRPAEPSLPPRPHAEPTADTAATAAPPSQPDQPAAAPSAPPAADAEATWPGIRVDRERRQVDIDATVVLREGEWLELIACTRGTREHEAIVAIDAQPSHIHLALLSLGLQPGDPIQSRMEGGKITVVPPQGPAVEVFFVVDRDGETIEVPAHEWVLDQANQQPMPPARFLFTGSAFVNYEGRQVYMADLEGSAVSLVNFGDDLVTRDTTQTNQTDNAQWGLRTEAIPPVGTKVTLRLRAGG